MPSTNAHGSHDLDPSDDLHGLKILVVEDSLDVGEALKELLILLGASVIGPAASTAEAQNLIAQCLPDVARFSSSGRRTVQQPSYQSA